MTATSHVGQWRQVRRGGRSDGESGTAGEKAAPRTGQHRARRLDADPARGASVRGGAGRFRRGRPGRGSRRWASAADSSGSWHQG
jgi:hypothetical protein